MDDKEERVSKIIVDCAYVALAEGMVFETDIEFTEFLEKIKKHEDEIDKIFDEK